MAEIHRGPTILILTLMLAFGLSGCGGGRPEPVRAPVAGTVTLDGEPLADGTIYFKSIAEGSIDALPIREGKFEGRVELGDRRVEICQYRDGPPINMGPTGQLDSKINVLPARFNTQSTLSATVTEQGPNQFAFQVTSK